MVEDLWDSVVPSPWSPELSGLGVSFKLALSMSLGFDCWVFLWWVLPSSWLSEGHSIPHLLFFVGQVVLELVLPCVPGFEAFVLLLLSCLFWVISSLFSSFPDRSWVELVWLSLCPSPSPVLRCWCYLCWWVSSSRRYPGVHSFYQLFFVIGFRGKAK